MKLRREKYDGIFSLFKFNSPIFDISKTFKIVVKANKYIITTRGLILLQNSNTYLAIPINFEEIEVLYIENIV